jgi:hypothetical protein
MIVWKCNALARTSAGPQRTSPPPRELSKSAREMLNSGASISWLLIVIATFFLAAGCCFVVCGPSEPLLYKAMGLVIIGIAPSTAALAAAFLIRLVVRRISHALDPAERVIVRYALLTPSLVSYLRDLVRLHWLLLVSCGPIVFLQSLRASIGIRSL